MRTSAPSPSVRGSIRRRVVTVVVATLLALGALFLILLAYAQFYPRTENAVERFPGEQPVSVDMPFMDYSTVKPRIDLSFDLIIPSRFTPKVFVRYYRDKTPLDSFTVNGVGVAVQEHQLKIDLSSVLHSGRNRVVLSMHGEEQYPLYLFAFEPSHLAPATRLLFFACAAAILCWFRAVVRTVIPAPLPRAVSVFLIAGVLLRVGYAFAIPYYINAYDVSGHLDYVRFVAAHWSVPLSLTSWQAHQAPLYYFLVAPLYLGTVLTGFPPALSFMFLHEVSVLLAIGTLLTGVSVLRSLFRDDPMLFLFSALFLSVFPGIIFFSSINNDVLVTFVGFLWFAAQYQALKQGTVRSWIVVGITVGLGLLSKGSAVLWMSATTACALFLRFGTVCQRIRSWIIALLTAAVLVSPLSLYRFMEDPNYAMLANTTYLVSPYFLDFTLSQMLRIDPVRLLKSAPNDDGSPSVRAAEDLRLHHPSFPEALILSSHFASSEFGSEGSTFLVFALFLLPVLMLGVYRCITQSLWFPVVTAACLLGGLLLFCIRSPFATSQNFRYIGVLALPLAIFVAEGTRAFPWKFFRIVAEVIVFTYSLTAFLFFFGIVMAT